MLIHFWAKETPKLAIFLVLTLELLPRGGDVGDDVGDVAEDGAEGEEADQQLEEHEDRLVCRAGRGQVADGGHGQDRPVHGLEVRVHRVAGHRVVEVSEHARRVFRAEAVPGTRREKSRKWSTARGILRLASI